MLRDQPFGIRITDSTGRVWAKLKAENDLSPESIGAWLAGYRAAVMSFLSVVGKEDRPVFEIHVDITWEVTDVDEITEIIEYEGAFTKVFNDF